MGTWGPEPFDNDTGCDLLGDVLGNLRKLVRDDLATLDDGILERRSIPAIACIRALIESFDAESVYIHRTEVEAWREMYLAWFDTNLSALAYCDSDSSDKERCVADREFQALLKALPENVPGTHPITDLLVHDIHPFVAEMEDLILQLHRMNPLLLWQLDDEPFEWNEGRGVDDGLKWLRDQLSDVRD